MIFLIVNQPKTTNTLIRLRHRLQSKFSHKLWFGVARRMTILNKLLFFYGGLVTNLVGGFIIIVSEGRFWFFWMRLAYWFLLTIDSWAKDNFIHFLDFSHLFLQFLELGQESIHLLMFLFFWNICYIFTFMNFCWNVRFSFFLANVLSQFL